VGKIACDGKTTWHGRAGDFAHPAGSDQSGASGLIIVRHIWLTGVSS
jgi:hypothetical protein